MPLRRQKKEINVDIEYRVRPVVRFMVTRFYSSKDESGVDPLGEFPNADLANRVGSALALKDEGEEGVTSVKFFPIESGRESMD